jgi:hypothetical protein
LLKEVDMPDAKESKKPAQDEQWHVIAEAVSAYQKLLGRSDLEGALHFGVLVYRKAPSYIWQGRPSAGVSAWDVEEDLEAGSIQEAPGPVGDVPVALVASGNP